MSSTPVREITLATVWRLARPGSLWLTWVACVLGTASAAGCGIAPDWAGAVAALLLALGLHMGVNLLHAGHQLVADKPALAELPGADPGLDLLRRGVITPTEARQVAWALWGLVALGGVALALKSSGGLLLLGAGGALLAWAYAAPPLRLGDRGAAALCAGPAWWLATLGADYVQRHHFFIIPAADAASFALLVAAATLLAQPPLRGRVALYLVLVMLAYGGLTTGVAWLVQPQQALWGLLSLPLSLAAAIWLWVARRQPARAVTARKLATAAAGVHGLVTAAALASVTLHGVF